MLERILLRWLWWMRTYPELRLGQALFSAAFAVAPEWATEAQQKVDPFYLDSNIRPFLLFLEEKERAYWEKN